MNNYSTPTQVLDEGDSVRVVKSTHPGASDYVGANGTITRITPRLVYAVKFNDGETWFYARNDLRRA